MARPLKVAEENNVLVRQSNYITTARYEYTAIEKRILYRIVEKAFECRMANLDWFKANDGKYTIKEHKSLVMPITAFMTKEQQENGSGEYYEQIVDAFNSLVDKKISFRGQGEFSFGGILNFADQIKGEGTVSFMVHRFVWQSALDFSKGFTKLDLVTAMELKSAYSMRFYELAKSWQDRMHCSLSVQEFREMFGCTNKYAMLNDLKRYVIEVAKKELDRVSPISFYYDQEKAGRTVTKFNFHFYENKKNISEAEHHKELLSKNPQGALPPNIKNWLTKRLGLTKQQRESNIKLFDSLYSTFGNDTITELEETYQYIYRQGCRPEENIGWFIQNLKKKVENASEKDSFNDREKIHPSLNTLYDKFSNK